MSEKWLLDDKEERWRRIEEAAIDEDIADLVSETGQYELALGLPGKWTKTAWQPPVDLAVETWQAIGPVLSKMEGAVHWWIGDWMNAGERRWGQDYAKAVETTGFSYGTVKNDAYVAKNVSYRYDALSWTHHLQVAPLEPEAQRMWLGRAEQEGWSVSELRKALRQATKESPQIPNGHYAVIYADPAWAYDNSGFDQSADQQYPTMTPDEIAALPVGQLAFDECVLFLWATSPLLPEAIRVMEAWGFQYKASRVWVKDRAPGIGWFIRTRHELLLIGVRGQGHPKERLDSIIEGPVTRHSEKPKSVYDDIEACYSGPYIELFARNTRPGWEAWGNELE